MMVGYSSDEEDLVKTQHLYGNARANCGEFQWNNNGSVGILEAYKM